MSFEKPPGFQFPPERKLETPLPEKMLLSSDPMTQQLLRNTLQESSMDSERSGKILRGQYRRMMVEELLKNGALDVESLLRELKEEAEENPENEVDERAFRRAAREVYDLNAKVFETPETRKEQQLSNITLTEDSALLQRLQAKLDVYKKRLKPFHPREQREPGIDYKFGLLQDLLRDGSLDVTQQKEVYQESERDDFDEKQFWNAVEVIKAYNQGNTEGLKGGSGF